MNFIGNIVNVVLALTTQFKTLLLALGALSFVVGGIIHAMGGVEGQQKAKKWYWGATFGIVIGLCSKGIVELLQSLLNF